MTRLKMWTGVFAFVLVSTVVSGMAVPQDPKAQDPTAQAPKVQDKVLEGMLVGIDQNTKVLTLKADDKEVQFQFTDRTELVAPTEEGKPAVVKQGAKMRVHYTENAEIKIATKIEVIESSAAR